MIKLFKVKNSSLKSRIAISALLIILLILPLIGFTLHKAFEKQITSAVENELSAFTYAILALAEVEEGRLVMPEQLLENQFNVIQSGLYALITTNNSNLFNKVTRSMNNNIESPSRVKEQSNQKEIIWSSPSYLGITKPNFLVLPLLGESAFYQVKIDNSRHFAYSFSVNFNADDQAYPMTLHIIKDAMSVAKTVAEFQQKLWLWLIVLMLLLLAIQYTWLKWTMKPLHLLQQELANIESGKSSSIDNDYPEELNQVTSQLNTLLATEQQQRTRYRNALSDLAHSLKTPLAVIQSQENLPKNSLEQLTIINQTIEHQLKRAQSAGESSWRLGVNVLDVVLKLQKTFGKIYAGQSKKLNVDVSKEAIFKGDEADLMEILGNLLDNAYKAADTTVKITVTQQVKDLSIVIEDDGAGIEDEQKLLILQRGTRADTYEYGHGIGLAIVKDLVASYQGKLDISRSPNLDGARFTIAFST